MEEEIAKLTRFGDAVTLYGREMVLALAILVAGLIASRLFIRLLRSILQRFTANQSLISMVSTSLHVVLVVLVIAAALHQAGVATLVIRRILLATSLAAVGLIVIFRPYIPTLPYKVGNSIEVGGLVGKVEATTFLNTRLRTFDGKTLFIPNRMILNDILTNYHFTPTRRIRAGVTISYRDDLQKAKKVLAEVFADDPNVLEKPAPRVYVTELRDDGVKLSVRGWVENAKYLRIRSDLLEKIKLRFDQEGITISLPRRDVHLNVSGNVEGTSVQKKVFS